MQIIFLSINFFIFTYICGCSCIGVGGCSDDGGCIVVKGCSDVGGCNDVGCSDLGGCVVVGCSDVWSCDNVKWLWL